MDFNGVIDKIIPEVENGSNEPFLIYRDGSGDWHCDFTQNQYGDTFDWFEDKKSQDPFAVTFKGSDFAKGSLPYVYDKVLTARLLAEYNSITPGDANSKELYALVNFLEDNMGELSSEATDYITQFYKPLDALYRMIPENLIISQPGEYYNEEKAWQAFEIIEDRIDTLIKRRAKDEVAVSSTPQKRNIDGYEEITSIRLAGRVVVLAENPDAAESYLVCNIKWDNPLGMEERYDGAVTDNYLEAISEFITRQTVLLGELRDERTPGFPFHKLTDEYCIPGGLDKDLEGKVIIIKPEALSPEYRDASHQIKLALSGFGCAPNSRGNAVYCKDLYSGKESRFERRDILGVADIERLPEWAKTKLKTEPQKTKKPSLLGKLDDNKQRVKRDKAAQKDKPVTKKKGDLEVD